MRWRIAILVSAAIAISYLDRQALPVAVKAISKDIPLSNEQFSTLQSAFLFAYALMYAGGGKLVDVLGTRRGFTVVMLFWSFHDDTDSGGKTAALIQTAEAYSVPVIPHAGQMHNYHVAMASLNSPMAEYFPIVDVEVGNELFWYIFQGEPKAKDGYINLDDNTPGLGLTINEAGLERFEVIE